MKAVIFDLDGTILKSMEVWEVIDEKFLAKRGFSVPEGYVAEICARSFREAAEYTINLFNLTESADEIMAEWHEMAIYEYENNIKLVPTAYDYLTKLKDKKIKLAVATGLSEALYKPCLINNGIYDFFDVLCSTDHVERGKEHPDVYLLAAEKLGAEPKDCVVFEDVLPAVKSAKKAGMTVYALYDEASKNNRAEIEKISDGYLFDFENAPLF